MRGGKADTTLVCGSRRNGVEIASMTCDLRKNRNSTSAEADHAPQAPTFHAVQGGTRRGPGKKRAVYFPFSRGKYSRTATAISALGEFSPVKSLTL